MSTPVFADEGLERQLCGWMVGAPLAEVARVLPRLREGLFTLGIGRLLAAALRERVSQGLPTDAAALLAAIRAAGADMSATLLAQWHVEWAEMVTPPTSLLDALEDMERQRIARSIKQAPPSLTGRDSVQAIREALAAVPLATGVRPVAAFDVALEVAREFADPNPQARVLTGIERFDVIAGGFEPGDLIVLGARTSVGKTVMALRLARGMWHAMQRPVLYHSMEMSRHQLVKRCIADVATIENWRVQRGAWEYDDQVHVAMRGANTVANWTGLHFLDASAPFPDLCALYEQWIAMHGDAAAIVVDYIGLIRGVPGAERRYQELGIITHTLKAMARRLGIVVIAVSQLNRQAALSDGPPQLHELRESGDIEQDADSVLLMHQPFPESDSLVAREQLNVIIAKHRSGRLGIVELQFVRDFCRIEEAGQSEAAA